MSTPVTPAEQSSPVVSMTQAEIQKMIADAIAAGVASAQPVVGLSQPPVVEKWTVNRLLKSLVHGRGYHTEAEYRAAHAAVDTHFPEPADEAEVTV